MVKEGCLVVLSGIQELDFFSFLTGSIGFNLRRGNTVTLLF